MQSIFDAYQRGYEKIASLVSDQIPNLGSIKQMYQNAIINHDTRFNVQPQFANPRSFRFSPNETLVSYKKNPVFANMFAGRGGLNQGFFRGYGSMTPEMKRRSVMM